MRVFKCIGLLLLGFLDLGATVSSTYEYGVGFSLSLDYGVASVQFINGTSIDIAKIEGSPSYKAVMRSVNIGVYDENSDYEAWNAWSSSRSAHSSSMKSWFQKPIQPTGLRDWLPPWLGGEQPEDQRVGPLRDMLHTLQISVETYLGSKIADAEVVIPFPYPPDNEFREALVAASSDLQHRLSWTQRLRPGGVCAARALNLKDPRTCGTFGHQSCGEQLILTIDYSRAAMTALVIAEEFDVFAPLHVMHNTSLGAEAGSGVASFSHFTRLVDAFRNLTDLLWMYAEPDHGPRKLDIHHLVLTGEAANDLLMNAALKKVLRERHASKLIEKLEERENSIDPVYAVANAVAQHCLEMLTYDPCNFNFC